MGVSRGGGLCLHKKESKPVEKTSNHSKLQFIYHSSRINYYPPNPENPLFLNDFELKFLVTLKTKT